MIKELLTREDYYNAIIGGEGVILIADVATGRTARCGGPPIARPHNSPGEHGSHRGRKLSRR